MICKSSTHLKIKTNLLKCYIDLQVLYLAVACVSACFLGMGREFRVPISFCPRHFSAELREQGKNSMKAILVSSSSSQTVGLWLISGSQIDWYFFPQNGQGRSGFVHQGLNNLLLGCVCVGGSTAAQSPLQPQWLERLLNMFLGWC